MLVINTAALAMSLQALIMGCLSGATWSARYSIAVLMSSTVITKQIVKTRIIHSEVLRSIHQPRADTPMAAIKCIVRLGSVLNAVPMP